MQDGQTAFERLRHNRYAAILCDLKMPGLSGQRLFELLEQGDSESARRMIFMTGDVVSDKSQRFFKSQGRLCLSKPFSLEELLETIKGVANAPSSGPIRKS